MFFDAVYKKGTQGEKYQAKSVQYGRSVVEMLGLLALIGVLSVGGIAGYNKAMWMYKSNKQAEQMSQIISAINRYKFAIRYSPMHEECQMPQRHENLGHSGLWLRMRRQRHDEQEYPHCRHNQHF